MDNSQKPGSNPRNRRGLTPLLNKGHAHRSDKDYNRQAEKKKLKQKLRNLSG